ncbi:hypothetical protein H632_c429p0 [Helicosporidium sp. ATCC 50920]|nr:hypothetical protein H632_c429p0 [Helicosporidium sp. ATCC 50920]|eukprot:KDD75933.1 hypothetical protein H632_c429p0 [Helicosporidium sp. ATCC 50920]
MKQAVVRFLQKHPIVAFIKGTREAPRCGFSNKVVQILNDTGCDYATVNVLDSEEIRSGMKVMSGWPTFPQVYFEGEFFGGCDILVEAARSGDLHSQLAKIAKNSSNTSP